jgi:ribosomal protein L24E
MRKATLCASILVVGMLLPTIGRTATSGSDSMTTRVTLAGLVTCAHCGLNVPKGQTRMSWALQNVNQGDGIVLITDDGKAFKTYSLNGQKDKLMKYLGREATITGDLDGTSIEVAKVKPRIKEL